MEDARNTPHHAQGADPVSADRLVARGLELRRIRNDDPPEFDAWLEAMSRGFLEGERTAVQRDAAREHFAERRLIGVLDPAAPDPRGPVGTVASWAGRLSVPGGEVSSCAISDVSVAPTHRRRGIARALLEGELRTAAASGLAVASLTVSESPLYGRYGFGPAADVASLTLDVKRAAWTGPVPPGRVDFVSRERWRALAPEVFERVRVDRPGEFDMPEGHWDRFAGTRPDAEKAELTRAVQYADADGRVRGLALYSVTVNPDDFARSTVDIGHLLADGDDAYAALWRFFVELDLIARVRAEEQSVDEPVLWMISDRRAATVSLRDHHYLRVLDVPRAFEARRYAAPGVLALEVDDPLGFAAGSFVLTVDEAGAGRVDAGVPAPADAVTVRLGIAELSALYLGGVSVATLAAAGRVEASDRLRATAMLSWPVRPRLSYWY